MDGIIEDIEGIYKGELKERLWNKIYEMDFDSWEKKLLISEVQFFFLISLFKVCEENDYYYCWLINLLQIKVNLIYG